MERLISDIICTYCIHVCNTLRYALNGFNDNFHSLANHTSECEEVTRVGIIVNNG